MTYLRWILLMPLGVASIACGPDGPDASSTESDDVGIEIIAGGDSLHVEHADDQVSTHSDEMADDSSGGVEKTGAHNDELSDSPASAMPVPGGDADEMVEHHEDADHDTADSDADSEGGLAASEGGTVVNVEMVEFGFVADVDELPLGEPIVFRFSNTGAVPHEAMFGTHHQQDEFAASAGHGDHGTAGHHGDVAAITLDPGASSEMVIEFAEAGEVWIGCHLPGHYDAGMAASFAVI